MDGTKGDTDASQEQRPEAQAGRTGHSVATPATGSSGISSGLQPGGTLPSTGGLGGLGSLGTPDAASGGAAGGKAEGGSA
jgi:hypothetical protein